MEDIFGAIGEDTAEVLKEHELNTVPIFLVLTQEIVMIQLKLKLGAWLRIERAQKQLQEQEILPNKIEPTSENCHNDNEIFINEQKIIEILQRAPTCQRLLYGKLAQGTCLDRNEKNSICRILCAELFATAINKGLTIKSATKQKLAICLVNAYDCLKSDVNGKPAEADWYWEHNGDQSGSHTGMIYNWVRNEQNKSPAKLSRKRPAVQEITQEIVDALTELEAFTDDEAYRQRVFQLYQITYPYRNALRKMEDSSTLIMTEFPLLAGFQGDLILDEYNHLNPAGETVITFENIVPLCSMLNTEYDDVACCGVRALLKLMKQLSQQGRTVQADPSGLPPLEDYACVFIRWKRDEEHDIDFMMPSPFIYCNALAFAIGNYFVIVEGKSIDCGDNFFKAYDILYKTYKTYNFPTPHKAKKVFEFFDILVYQAYKFSRIATVNRMVERIRTALKRDN